MAKIYRNKSMLKKNVLNKLLITFISFLIFIISIILLIINFKNGIIIEICISVILVVGLYYSKKNYTRYKILNSGLKGEKQTIRILKKLPKNYYVLNNVYIKHKGRKKELDFIVIGPNGVFIVEVKNHKGEIVGNYNDEVLVQNKMGKNGGKYSKEFKNPLMQLNEQVVLTKNFLLSYNLNISINGVVYFSNDMSKLNVNGRNKNVISGKNNLISYIVNKKTSKRYDKNYIIGIIEKLRT